MKGENMMNPAHKATNESYRKGWDKTFRKKKEKEKNESNSNKRRTIR